MPTIKSSTELRNHYNQVSTYCRTTREPVYITKNGRGDLVVMSVDVFNILLHKCHLYRLIEASELDFFVGRAGNFAESTNQIKKDIKNGTRI